jgi:hypothetical protein
MWSSNNNSWVITIMPVIFNDIVTVDVTAEQIDFAKSMRKERDALYGNIYAEKPTDMRWVGDLGEIIVNNLFNMCRPKENEWHINDVLNKPDFTFCGITIDVKTVKRKVPIQISYTAQITAKHINTPVEYLVFTSYEFTKNKLHILGAISKHEFIETADYYGAGDSVHKDYTIREGHEIYLMKISNMTPFRDFVRSAMRKSPHTQAA